MQAQLSTDPGSWNSTVTRGIGRRIEVEQQIRRRVGLPPHNNWIPGHFIRDHVLEPSLCILRDMTRKLLNDGSRRMSIRRCVPARLGYDRVSTDGAYTAGYRASYAAVARKYTNLEITEHGRCFGFRLGWTKLMVPFSWYHELVGGLHGLLLAVILHITHLELVLDNRDAAVLIENLFLPGATYEIQVEGEEEEWIASAKQTVLDEIKSLIHKHWIDEDGSVRIDIISVYREENFGADNMSHLVSEFRDDTDYTPLTRIHGEPDFYRYYNEYFDLRDWLSYYIRYFGNFDFLIRKALHYGDLVLPVAIGGGQGIQGTGPVVIGGGQGSQGRGGRGPVVIGGGQGSQGRGGIVIGGGHVSQGRGGTRPAVIGGRHGSQGREERGPVVIGGRQGSRGRGGRGPEANKKEVMTLGEYEKVLEEKRKVLVALKAEERKVEVDEAFESMELLNKGKEKVIIKLGSDKDSGKKKVVDPKYKTKSVREWFFQEGESSTSRSGGGRRRNRGRDGGRNNSNARSSPAAPSIDDPDHFPSLGGK